MVDVYLDLDSEEAEILNISDEELVALYLKKFLSIASSISKRMRETKRIGISYDTPSVALFDQAKDLYFLGYFVSTIMVCRSIAEYLAYEIFYEEIDLKGSPNLIKQVAENLDFRKIVNEFLYNPQEDRFLIDKISHDFFNEVYDVGNNWIHPKNLKESKKIEFEAKAILEKTQSLISSLRNVMKDYDVSKGKLVMKPEARKKVRPIVLGSSMRKSKA